MANSFKKIALDALVGIEGGYVNNPDDSGKETNWGITALVAREYGYTGSLKDLTREKALEIYDIKYWQKLSLDEICLTSWKIAEELLDTGVNCGVERAGEYLQRCLNVLNMREKYYPDLRVDGNIGFNTVTALRSFFARREKYKGEETLLKALNCLQGTHYIELTEKRQKDESFVYGWISRRIFL